MFVAIRFSWRRFRHQMDLPVLMWKQTLTLPPWSSVCNANIASNAHTELFSSILKWPSLDRLSTNCTLTFGSSHCRLLIFPRMKSVRFQLRVKRKETEMPLRVESESNVAGNLMYFTALWRLCLYSHVIIFRQICALTFKCLRWKSASTV